jgi:hypothetical protein
MRIYCIATDCPKKSADYAHCTGLLDINDCPKVKAKKELEAQKLNEKDSQSDCDI